MQKPKGKFFLKMTVEIENFHILDRQKKVREEYASSLFQFLSYQKFSDYLFFVTWNVPRR